jgi:acyl carrier protein
MTTFERVVEILSEMSGWRTEDIKPETTVEMLGLDSLDMVSIEIMIEDEFNQEIDLATAQISDVAELVEYVKA